MSSPALRADIERNGQLEPIVVMSDEHADVWLVDGRHRLRACDELGIEPKMTELPKDADVVAFAISKNINRRSLTESQRAMAAAEISLSFGELRGRKDKKDTLTLSESAALMAVSAESVKRASRVIKRGSSGVVQAVRMGHAKVSDASRIVGAAEEDQDRAVAYLMENPESTLRSALSKVKESPKEAALSKPAAGSDSKFCLHVRSVKDMIEVVEAESLDMIVTGPPYERKALPAYADLAEFAAHALKPGGSLLCMTGCAFIPEVLDNLKHKSLRYQWQIGYFLGGDRASVMFRNVVNCGHRPVYWYIKPPKKGAYEGKHISDTVTGSKQEDAKTHHKWGQSVDGMVELMSKFAPEKETWTICDPFVGGGSTGVATLLLGHVFIGGDVDGDCIQKTDERLRGVQNDG